jgi:hypothetical protein
LIRRSLERLREEIGEVNEPSAAESGREPRS